jgi:hypothetical protein
MVNLGTRVMRRPRPESMPTARAVAVIIATVGLTGLAASCGGSPGSTNAGGSASSLTAVAYSNCMRSHGVPRYPDPDSNGQLRKTSAQLLGVSSSQLQSAQTACQSMYPGNGGAVTASLMQCEETGDCPQAMVQQVMSGMRQFSQCMRSHGVAGWPDPTIDSEGRPGFNLLHVQGFDPNSPQIETTMQQCEHTMPGGAPVPVIRPGGPG